MKLGIFMAFVLALLGLTAIISSQLVATNPERPEEENEVLGEKSDEEKMDGPPSLTDDEADGSSLLFDDEEAELQRAWEIHDGLADAGAVTAASIKDRYEEKFADLQEEAIEQIQGLVSEAIAEYQERMGNEEGISYWYFYRKYYGAVKDIEGQVDERFYGKYEQLLAELEANGYDTEKAEVFKKQYEESKSNLLSMLISSVF